MKFFSIEKILSWILMLLVFVLPWQTVYIFQEAFLHGSKWQAATIGFYATEVLVWLTFGIFFIRYLKNKRIFDSATIRNFSWTPDRKFLASVLVFVLYLFFSVFWSQESALVWQQALRLLQGSLLFILFLSASYNTLWVFISFLCSAILQSILALFQFFTQSTFTFKWLGLVAHPVGEPGTSVVVGQHIGRVLRAYGAFSHPNVLGGYLVIAMALCLFLLFEKKGTQRVRWFFWSALFIQMLGLIVTFSRSAWLGTAVLFGFFIGKLIFERSFRFLQTFLLVLCFTIPLSIHVFPIVSSRLQGVSLHEIQSTSERISGIQVAWSLFQQQPVFGVGAGNFTVSTLKQNPILEGWENQPVHNVPLLILAELGILGVGLFFLCLWTLFRFIHNLYTFRLFEVFFYLGMVVFPILGMSLFDHYWYSSWSGVLLVSCFFGLSIKYFFLNKISSLDRNGSRE